MYRALYRKWRPVDFDDVWGQDQVTGILKYEVATGKLSHAYLFCGSRGTGKTSSAKILAKAVNCLSPRDGNPCNECEVCRSIDAGTATDVIEMDAASNTGVDDVRDIRDAIVYTPAEMKYRVYIIDEVHMMTGSAFNALLKTLEEPPSHVIFILATTELHKLPATIVSRCQRFDFRRISTPVLSRRLMHIAGHEGIDLTDGGARMLSRLAIGGMRDAISLLELCAGMKVKIDEALVSAVCGGGDREATYKLIEAIAARRYSEIYATIHELVMSSRDLTVFWRDLIDGYRDMMVAKTAESAAEYLDLTDAEAERLRTLAGGFSMEQLIYHSHVLEDVLARVQRTGTLTRAAAELALTRLCDPRLSTDEESLLARIADLETRLAMVQSGAVAPTAPVAPAPAAPAPATPPAPMTEKPKEAPAMPVSPAPPTTTEGAEAPPTPKAEAPAPPPSAGDTSAFRPFLGWQEVIETVGERNPAFAAPLSNSRAAITPEGQLTVRLENPFYLTLLNRDSAKAIIRAVAATVGDVPIMGIELQAKGGASTASQSIIEALEAALRECK